MDSGPRPIDSPLTDFPHTIRLVVFDLDGTLLDSFEDIRRALNHALAAKGFPTHPTETVKGWVGDGAARLVERALPREATGARDEILAILKEYYADHAADASTPYPGALETLELLRACGTKLAILTNKPHGIALGCCERTGLAERVDRIRGEAPGQPLKPDPEALLPILREFEAPPAATLFVGDGEPDAAIARACGTRLALCTWGTLARERIAALGPDAVLERAEELLGFVRSAEGKTPANAQHWRFGNVAKGA